jgi:hypothetical protein
MYCTFLPNPKGGKPIPLKSILESNFKVINHYYTLIDGNQELTLVVNNKTVVILPNNSVAIK